MFLVIHRPPQAYEVPKSVEDGNRGQILALRSYIEAVISVRQDSLGTIIPVGRSTMFGNQPVVHPHNILIIVDISLLCGLDERR